jgi:putative ATPase
MRPRTLDEFVGQVEYLGPGRLLRSLIETDQLRSAIFFGPPGCGKTTLALVIAERSKAHFERLHAAEATVKDVRAAAEAARGRLAAAGQRTIVFIDEINRFSRTQQDSLLRDVEDGLLILLGATTENPYAALTTPLVSRSHVFEFKPLALEELRSLASRALTDRERGLGAEQLEIDADALDLLAVKSDGDARRILTALETAAAMIRQAGRRRITAEVAAEALQRKVIPFDAAGDTHYDLASAFIKSMRGSDPDATLYWLARMLEGGEDPRFIARRIVIQASEDVGNADPQALVVATAAAAAVQQIGLPECQLALAQAAVYVACAPKSNAITTAIGAARQDVREGRTLPVPEPLRDQSFRRGELEISPDEKYRSPHNTPDGFIAQPYMPEPRRYYQPTGRGFEAELAERLKAWRAKMPNRDAVPPAS